MKTKIITSVILVIAGMLLGYGISRTQTKSVDIPVEISQNENAYSQFIDSLELDEKNEGSARSVFEYPEKGLQVFFYPTSQETGKYGVYDASNDIVYSDIGDSFVISTTPLAFVGTDKLLMYATDYDTPVPPILTVTDFENNTLTTLITGSRIENVKGDYGSILTMDVIGVDNQIKKYSLNTQTLEFKEI